MDAARQSESPEVIEYLESEYEKHFPSKKKKSKKKSSGRPSFAFLKRKGSAETISFKGVVAEGGEKDHSRAFRQLDYPGGL